MGIDYARAGIDCARQRFDYACLRFDYTLECGGYARVGFEFTGQCGARAGVGFDYARRRFEYAEECEGISDERIVEDCVREADAGQRQAYASGHPPCCSMVSSRWQKRDR